MSPPLDESAPFLEQWGFRAATVVDGRGRRVPLLRVGAFVGGRDAVGIEPAILAIARRSVWRSIGLGNRARLLIVVVLEVIVIGLSSTLFHSALTNRLAKAHDWILPTFMILMAIAMIVSTWRSITRGRAKGIAWALVNEAGCCASCGYALKGLVAEGDGCVVCPECRAAWSGELMG